MIKIKYDGEFPNLCSGKLEVWIDNKYYLFPDSCLISGGNVYFDSDWNDEVTEGEWSISEYPEDFPEGKKDELLEVINSEIPWGCCGGCI